MTRKVFYSFHFDNDSWRAAQVRNIGALTGEKPVDDNKWEEIKRNGDNAIKKWIDDQLKGTSCTIVLIGSKTASRKWIKYEIEQSWKHNKGVLGIYIHNLEDQNGEQAKKGNNPFDNIYIGNGQIKKLSSIVSCHNPPDTDSTKVYKYIDKHIASWVETAIKDRQK